MAELPWWVDDVAARLVVSIPSVGMRSVSMRFRVRVDTPHPRRREKSGDYIVMGDGYVTLAARQIWAGWTPGYVLEITLADGTLVTTPWAEWLVCCDMHGTNCEPPGDLCCWYCSESSHPRHTLMPCVQAEPHHAGGGR